MSPRIDKARIIAAALPIMTAKGFRGTTMREIAADMGIKAGSIYYHVRCKDEILENIHDFLIDELLKKSEEIVFGSTIGTEKKLELFSQILLETLVERKAYAVVFFTDHKYLSKPYVKRINEKRIKYQGILQKIIEEGIETGKFKKLDCKTVTRGILGMLLSTYTWLKKEYDIKKIAKMYNNMILNGISIK